MPQRAEFSFRTGHAYPNSIRRVVTGWALCPVLSKRGQTHVTWRTVPWTSFGIIHASKSNFTDLNFDIHPWCDWNCRKNLKFTICNIRMALVFSRSWCECFSWAWNWCHIVVRTLFVDWANLASCYSDRRVLPSQKIAPLWFTWNCCGRHLGGNWVAIMGSTNWVKSRCTSSFIATIFTWTLRACLTSCAILRSS